MEQGLPTDRVKRILCDSRGFVWLATGQGLSRFDGERFTNYHVKDGLPINSVNELIETRSGVYLAATNGGGVGRWDSRSALAVRFEGFRAGDSSATNRVNTIYEDRAGRIWAGTEAGLFVAPDEQDLASFRLVELPLPASQETQPYVSAFAEGEEGRLWVGTRSGVFQRSTEGRVTLYRGLERPVEALLVDRKGRLWVGLDTGVLVTKRAAMSETTNPMAAMDAPNSQVGLPPRPEAWNLYTNADGLASGRIVALLQASDGHIWIGADGGLTVFDGHEFRTYTSRHGLQGDRVNALAEDEFGNIWIGQTLAGLKLAPSGFVTYEESDGLAAGSLFSLFEGPAGELCALQPLFRVSCLEGERFVPVFPLPVSARHQFPYFRRALEDSRGEWWIPSQAGLYRFPRVRRFKDLERVRPLAVYTRRHGLVSDDVVGPFEDSRGDIWMGARAREPVMRWERASGVFHRYSERDGLLPYGLPIAWAEDRSGGVWVGFREHGLFRFRHGRFESFAGREAVPYACIRALYKDSVGRLWVATEGGGGLYRADRPEDEIPRFQRYTPAEGLVSDAICCMTEDDGGHLYVPGTGGVNRLDPQTGEVYVYTTLHGLAGNESHEVAFRDRKGHLWFGMNRGLSRLVPHQPKPVEVPQALIHRVDVDGVRLSVSELGQKEVPHLKLEVSPRQLRIEFFALSFSLAGQLRFQWRLDEMDPAWSALTAEHAVHYAGLPPGRYRFQIRAVTADGRRSGMPALFSFEVPPPFWRRPWFVATSFTLVGLVLLSLHRYRVARLLETQSVRTRIASDLHDDLGSSLSRIAILSELAQRQIVERASGALGSVADVTRTARELLDGLNAVVWSIDPRLDDMRSLLSRLRRLGADLFEATGVHWVVDAPADVATIQLGAEQRYHLFLILKEALHNAARHAAPHAVKLTAHVRRGRLEVAVIDDGCGFAPKEHSSGRIGYGLSSMADRASRLHGELRIDSELGHGTRIHVSVPIR